EGVGSVAGGRGAGGRLAACVSGDGVVCARSWRVRSGPGIAAVVGCSQPVVDRVAEGAAGWAQWEFRPGGGVGDGAGGLQDLFAGRGVDGDSVCGEESPRIAWYRP